MRTDLLSGRDVLLVTSRADRPDAFLSTRSPVDAANCPFCPGHEHETPPEILRVGSEAHWSVRIVPNRYPAVSPDSDPPSDEPDRVRGSHEVIIESPDHDARFETLSPQAAAVLVDLLVARFRTHWENPKVESVILFKNQGRLAGSSIPHLHSQLLALDQPVQRLTLEAHNFREAVDRGSGCPLCAVVRDGGALVVAQSEWFVAAAPEISRSPYQIRVFPRDHLPSMAALSSAHTADLADLLQRLIAALNDRLEMPDFNWTFQNAPREEGRNAKTFHWYLEITPRVTVEAGFELATGVILNIVDPADAARSLRSILGPVRFST